MLDDQTRIHRDFNRLEECASKDNTCDAEVSQSQNLSKVRRSWDKYRIEIFSVKNRQSCLEGVCVCRCVCVCVRERERGGYRIANAAPNIFHLIHSVWPLFITLHQAWRLTYMDHSNDLHCPWLPGTNREPPQPPQEDWKKRGEWGLGFRSLSPLSWRSVFNWRSQAFYMIPSLQRDSLLNSTCMPWVPELFP